MSKASGTGILRHLLLAAGALVLLVVVLLLVVSLIRIPIDVSRVKGTIEAAASEAFGREVEVAGGITVTTSLWPHFEIEEMRIANPDGFASGELASMKRARLGVSLAQLLQRKIHVDTFRVEGLSLDLVRGKDGSVNWALGGADDAPDEPAAEGTAEGGEASLTQDLAVDEIAFDDIAVRYTDEATGEIQEFVLEQCRGSAAAGERMALDMNGSLREEPFDLHLEASSLAEFLAAANTDLLATIEIAGTRLRFEGSGAATGHGRSRSLHTTVEGERLDSLDDLLAIDLPPIQNYRLAGQLTSMPGRLELSDLEVRIRESALAGTLKIDRTGKRPTATLALNAKTVQLDDFDLEGWSPEDAPEGAPEPDAKEEPSADVPPPAASSRPKLMSPEVLGRADLKLTLEVGEVLAGDDVLGRGNLELALTNGRITLEPLRLETPQGGLLLEASLKPDTVASEASLRVLIEEFDFGVLVRRLNPEADLGGTLSMDIDVRSSAGRVSDLLQNANGYIDVSGRPVNLAAGIVDLWAVNLLASVVSSAAEEEGEGASHVNCLISRWSMADGVLRADNLAVDTSKIRICGSGEIDFRDEDFDLVVAPTAKRPEFFSLATPLKVEGDFEGFEIGMKGGAIAAGTTTAVRFVISPVTVPMKRLVRTDLPTDGSDICTLPIGPHEGTLEPLPGCDGGAIRRFFRSLRSGP
jgi:uncharacterized protein involved in outer membrane biogenesis